MLVVEPNREQRSAIHSALDEAGFEVHAEPNGSRLQRALHDFRPDVAVLNAYFDDPPCGFTMTRILRRSTDLPTLLVVHEQHAVRFRTMGLRAGADQLILQPFSLDELVARVRALVRRTSRPGSSVVRVGDLVLDEMSRTAARSGAVVSLTPREFEILLTLARNPGRVVSKDALSGLADVSPWEDTSTLATQVSRLRRKLEAHGARLIHTVHGVGYVLRP